MKNTEVLKKAIEKAEADGFVLSNKKHAIAIENDILGMATGHMIGWESIVFDHNFAKAFWGEGCYLCPTRGHVEHVPMWQFQLQQMVLESDPIAYLQKFL